MALVDYSSDSSESEETTGPQPKKQKTSSHSQTNSFKNSESSGLPPLPPAFHDLYASTVRVSASDDPTLHQGRRRVNPHKVGNWPSHLYIEWHPSPKERQILSTLLTNLQSSLSSSSPSSSSSSSPTTISSFLTSDLGAPQPLHISLSRPIVLSTAQKDDFLARLESSVVRGSGLAPFALAPVGVEWHRTEESARSFLVLRVASVTLTSRERQEKNRNEEGKAAAAAAAAAAKEKVKAEAQNPHLTTLLRRSNALVTSFGQPALYAFARRPPSNPSRSKDESPSADRNADAEAHTNTEIDKAFHISIAWTFAPPDSELRRLTEKAFHGSIAPAPTTTTPDHLLLNAITPCGTNISSNGKPSHDGGSIRIDSTGLTTIKEAIGAMRVLVDGVKAKIGNVVTHVSLPDVRSRKNREEGRGLFGI